MSAGLSHRELTSKVNGMKPMLSHGFQIRSYDISFSHHVPHAPVTATDVIHWYTPTLGPGGAVLLHGMAHAPRNKTFSLHDLGCLIGAPQGHVKAEGRTLMTLARLWSFVPLRFDYGMIEVPTNVGYPTDGQRAKWGAINRALGESWLNQSTKEKTP